MSECLSTLLSKWVRERVGGWLSYQVSEGVDEWVVGWVSFKTWDRQKETWSNLDQGHLRHSIVVSVFGYFVKIDGHNTMGHTLLDVMLWRRLSNEPQSGVNVFLTFRWSMSTTHRNRDCKDAFKAFNQRRPLRWRKKECSHLFGKTCNWRLKVTDLFLKIFKLVHLVWLYSTDCILMN